MAFNYLKEAKRAADMLHVDDQYELAKSLAANCGYQLVAEDTDLQRIYKIKDLINDYKRLDGFIEMKGESKSLIIEGLEGLLK